MDRPSASGDGLVKAPAGAFALVIVKGRLPVLLTVKVSVTGVLIGTEPKFSAVVPSVSCEAPLTDVPVIGTATLLGLFLGAIGQGEFTDRFGRKAVYQFNLLLFGLATLAGAWSPSYNWLVLFRFLAGLGLGAEQPLCFSYTAEYAPKAIRGRTIAFMQFLGGAWPWPIGAIFAGRDDDSLGIGLSCIRVGSHAIGYDQDSGNSVRSSETALELTYQYQVTPWWLIQPDFQYTLHPGAGQNPNNPLQSLRNTFVVGVRTTITF